MVLNKTWVRTPNFRTLKRAGLLPANPYTFDIVKDTYMFGSWQRDDYYGKEMTQSTQRFGWQAQYLAPNASVGSYTLSSAEASAIDGLCATKLLLQMKDQKINIAQAIAERQQTMDLLAATAIKIAESFKNLKQGNIVAAARALGGMNPSRKVKKSFNKAFTHKPEEAAANGWLALQYGWKPLLNDVYGAAELLAQRVTKEIRGSAQQSVRRTFRKVVPCTFGGYDDHEGYAIQECTYIVKYKCEYWTSYDASHLLTQVGLSNPALIAWELTPYSFVVDWFLPVGNFISSLDATIGLTFRTGSKTVFQKRKTVWVCNKGPSSVNFKTTVDATAAREWDRVERFKLDSFPSPCLPSFKNPLGFDHVANAMALLTGAFSRGKSN